MDRARHPIAQVLLGFTVALALLASLFAPLWFLELSLIGLSTWFVWWVSTTPLDRLSSTRRIPRFTVFFPLGIGIAANLYLLRISGRSGLLVNLILFVTALAIGAFRVAKGDVLGELT